MPIPTATLAEIYLRQGHLARARDIYARLAAQAPDDEKIVRRLREIEGLLDGRPAAPRTGDPMIEWLEGLLEQIRKERRNVLR